MIEVIAERNNGFDTSFIKIHIRMGDKEIVMDKEDSTMLIEVLTARRGVISEIEKGQYQAHKLTLFSSPEPLNLVSYIE